MPTLLPPKQYTAKLSDKTVYNPKFERYAFELVEPNKLEFAAGQYVSFAITEQGHRRSWSISSSPEVDHGFELLIDPKPMGIGTKYLQNLKLGDEVKLLAPLGQFVVDDSGAEQAIDFVATGVGITPFRAMILCAASLARLISTILRNFLKPISSSPDSCTMYARLQLPDLSLDNFLRTI